MKTVFAIITILGFIAASTARAQVEPQATSPGSIAISGTLTYSARYSQIAEFYANRTGEMASIFGNLTYSSTGERHPTSIALGVGDSWALSGIGFSNGPYEDLTVSQSISGRRLTLLLHDQLGYRHGVGLVAPNPNSSETESVLTLNSPVLTNGADVRLTDRVNGFTSASISGGYNQLDYLNGDGRDTNALMVSGELNHRFEGRNEFFGEDSFVKYGYPNSTANVGINANSIVGGWSRTWTRKITTSVAAGPQWITFQSSTPLPSYTGYSVTASVSDALKLGTASASFTHGVEGGGGYFYGSQADDLRGSFSRQFGHHVGSELTLDFAGGYRRTDSLSATSFIGPQGNFNAKYGFFQATRQLGRHFSAYAGYTGTDQTSNAAVSNGLLTSLWQTVTFGLGFTPPPIHFRQ